MAKLIKNERIPRRMLEFTSILSNRLLVAAQAGIGKSQMVMPQRNIRLQLQRFLKLLNRLRQLLQEL